MKLRYRSALVGLAFVVGAGLLALADPAYAGGITEFATPMEEVLKTLTGPVGKVLSVLMLVLCGIGYWFTRGEEIAGLFKGLIGVVACITLIAFSEAIANKLFTFSGASL